jgi:hypothetical protein
MLTLLIHNSRPCHLEVIESLIVNYNQIIKNDDKCKIYLDLCKTRKDLSYCEYIQNKYPDIILDSIENFDYFIEITLYPNEYNKIKNKDPKKFFYISHRVHSNVFKNAPNIYYLTPLAKYNLFDASILPFSENKVKTDVPIFVIQGNLLQGRRNYGLLVKILENSYDHDFKIKLVGRGNLPGVLQKYTDKIILKNNLDFKNFHVEFADCYAILPLISKKTHRQYYLNTLTSTINYAKGYQLKCLIDKDLQSIYQLEKAVEYTGENDIVDSFKKILEEFYI